MGYPPARLRSTPGTTNAPARLGREPAPLGEGFRHRPRDSIMDAADDLATLNHGGPVVDWADVAAVKNHSLDRRLLGAFRCSVIAGHRRLHFLDLPERFDQLVIDVIDDIPANGGDA